MMLKAAKACILLNTYLGCAKKTRTKESEETGANFSCVNGRPKGLFKKRQQPDMCVYITTTTRKDTRTYKNLQ